MVIMNWTLIGVCLLFSFVIYETEAQCPTGMLQCLNTKCINASNLCNGNNDCDDWSDERFCIGTGTGQFTRPLVSEDAATLMTTRSPYLQSCGLETTTQQPIITDAKYNDRLCGFVGKNVQQSNGVYAHPGQFPWVAKLLIKYKETEAISTCGGTLIGSEWILTAAHCIVDTETNRKVEWIRVLLGRQNLTWDREQGDQERCGLYCYVHPRFNEETWNYDFALLQINPVEYKEMVQPVCMPESCDAVDNCSWVDVAGWGRTAVENSQAAMRAAQLTLNSRFYCTNEYSRRYTDQQLCVSRNDTSTCRADPGGPMTCKVNDRATVIGLASWPTAQCGEEDTSFIFARVCRALPWIQSYTGPKWRFSP